MLLCYWTFDFQATASFQVWEKHLSLSFFDSIGESLLTLNILHLQYHLIIGNKRTGSLGWLSIDAQAGIVCPVDNWAYSFTTRKTSELVESAEVNAVR